MQRWKRALYIQIHYTDTLDGVALTLLPLYNRGQQARIKVKAVSWAGWHRILKKRWLRTFRCGVLPLALVPSRTWNEVSTSHAVFVYASLWNLSAQHYETNEEKRFIVESKYSPRQLQFLQREGYPAQNSVNQNTWSTPAASGREQKSKIICAMLALWLSILKKIPLRLTGQAVLMYSMIMFLANFT